ncbi:VOC family protein [Streptomyces sp. ISL-10]|uniref:VOC family protein n=1 Tax=Streptomyces sp. ISL-10 TaxID=2819172 RepID=UPI0027E5BDC9|nr:VOC family protein [Streptomyces sp. ISL-10]
MTRAFYQRGETVGKVVVGCRAERTRRRTGPEERIAAAIAAGGRVVSDGYVLSHWVVADPEGNEACVGTYGRTGPEPGRGEALAGRDVKGLGAPEGEPGPGATMQAHGRGVPPVAFTISAVM